MAFNITYISINQSKTYGYISLLSDDEMLDAALILGASLRNTLTSYPLNILTLSDVSMNARKQLLNSNSGIISLIDVKQLEYRFNTLSMNTSRNIVCGFNKLHLWNLVNYTKLIYLDIDTMVVQNIDDLFEKPELNAALDIGGVVNTGVFVAQSLLKTFNDMMLLYKMSSSSYNRDDQRFINWYFTNRSNSKIHYLPLEYNRISWHKDYQIWDEVQAQAKIIHFAGKSKPWSFFYMPHRNWERNIEGQLFYKWKQMFEIVQKTIKQKG
ncbi:unnamed protein product [Rotaria sordida]|uniref:glycogenin glucosyltransferase n=1 Tax=Rotaria sordida TaxID=392033 RepID=A0A815NSY0_9BILA|nr:unnamed protein product [Rotaria sordida]CAF1634908.1 unnamed protein product [Rotaria sordida]